MPVESQYATIEGTRSNDGLAEIALKCTNQAAKMGGLAVYGVRLSAVVHRMVTRTHDFLEADRFEWRRDLADDGTAFGKPGAGGYVEQVDRWIA